MKVTAILKFGSVKHTEEVTIKNIAAFQPSEIREYLTARISSKLQMQARIEAMGGKKTVFNVRKTSRPKITLLMEHENEVIKVLSESEFSLSKAALETGETYTIQTVNGAQIRKVYDFAPEVLDMMLEDSLDHRLQIAYKDLTEEE